MYIVVQHAISNPAEFWTAAQQALPNLPGHLKLHHTFPTEDGRSAFCVWEAASVEQVKNLLEPMLGRVSSNSYYQVPNKEGISVPTLT